jgi:superfamily II DNA or RNA helicase
VARNAALPRGRRHDGSVRPAIDEAHSREGSGNIDRVTFELSECLHGAVDVEESHAMAVELGRICDTVFADIASHPEHASVLACFKTCRSARIFASACNAARAASALTYVGDDEAGDRSSLRKFADGDVRVLCVVGRVEMGINVHRCDTVLLAEPWDSANRTLQLIGRDVRLHPTKPGFFSILCTEAHSDLDARLSSLVRAPHTVGDGVDRVRRLARDAREPNRATR